MEHNRAEFSLNSVFLLFELDLRIDSLWMSLLTWLVCVCKKGMDLIFGFYWNLGRAVVFDAVDF